MDKKEIETKIKKLNSQCKAKNDEYAKIMDAVINAISDSSSFVSNLLIENVSLKHKNFLNKILLLDIKKMIEKKDYEKLEKLVKDVEIML